MLAHNTYKRVCWRKAAGCYAREFIGTSEVQFTKINLKNRYTAKK